MKTLLTILLAVALSCVLAQGIVIGILYQRYQNINQAYGNLIAEKNNVVCPIHIADVKKQLLWVPIDPEIMGGQANLATKNKNPFNIKRLNRDTWEGQIGVDRQGHVIFSRWEYGVRAAALTLRSYAQRHNVDTVAKLVKRFSENSGAQFEVYVNYICKRLKVDRDESIDIMNRIPQLLRIMAKYESGLDLPNELFAGYDVLGKAK